jgi:hypothetical protein
MTLRSEISTEEEMCLRGDTCLSNIRDLPNRSPLVKILYSNANLPHTTVHEVTIIIITTTVLHSSLHRHNPSTTTLHDSSHSQPFHTPLPSTVLGVSR